jgi:hypothetical protein
MTLLEMSNSFLLYPSPGSHSACTHAHQHPAAGARRPVEKILLAIFLLREVKKGDTHIIVAIFL